MAKKYAPLTQWLEAQTGDQVKASRTDLDALVGGLPPSAAERTWWGNTPRGQAASWIKAGWVVGPVTDSEVTFLRGTPASQGGTTSKTSGPVLDGIGALGDVLLRAGYPSITAAVAAHTVFLPVETVAQAKGLALFPAVRDPNRRGQFGKLADGRNVLFDDNSTPTDVFLWAAGRAKGPDVQFNHVWQASSDPDSYTALWNLCCTPAFLAKTSDTHVPTVASLRYRSWSLFGTCPPGETPPGKPEGFDELVWAPSPPPVDDLEECVRARLRNAPKRRATVTAATIGWLFSNGPDPEFSNSASVVAAEPVT